jgi:hypothetical protein
MKERLLFITKGGEHNDDGFSYVLELAKALNKGIAVVMVYKEKMMQEDVMAAVAFAEAGDLKTVEELMNGQEKAIKEAEQRRIKELTERARETSIDITCDVAVRDVAGAIKDFLKDRPNIEMVLLSPNLSEDMGFKAVKKLLKNISKPIVTIRPVKAEV